MKVQTACRLSVDPAGAAYSYQEGKQRLMKDPVRGVRKKSRFILEIRYPAAPRIFDSRGAIIDDIHPEIRDRFEHWQIGSGTISFADLLEDPSERFVISLKRTSITLEDPGSVQEFFDRSRKYLRLFHSVLGKQVRRLTRVGVRFIEIAAPSPPPSFDDVRDRVRSSFLRTPEDLELDFADVALVETHTHGRYQIGPVEKGENTIESAFTYAERNVPDAGVLMDIDSYETDVGVPSKADLIKAYRAAFEMTKAVEESLLSHLGWGDDQTSGS